ncbi:MAG: hypothetical protein ACRD3J_20280 [Thermoanaerobaculia bacterium]
MRSRVTFVAILLLLFLAQAGSASIDGGLTVTAAGHVISVSGLSPGSTAVFFGVAVIPIPHAYMNRVRRWAVTVDDTTNTGSVILDLLENVPPASVWAVVDLRNAHYGIFGGTGLGVREAVLKSSLKKGQSQNVDQFIFDHGYLDLLYVHPGLGSWTWSAIGGANPASLGPNNSTIVSLPDGKPLGQSGAAPPNFVPGGLLVAVDFTRLQIAVIPVDQSLIGAAP